MSIDWEKCKHPSFVKMVMVFHTVELPRYQSIHMIKTEEVVHWMTDYLLTNEGVDVFTDPFYLSATLISPSDGDIVQTAKLRYMASVLLSSLSDLVHDECPEESRKEVTGSIEELCTLYITCRNEGMPIALTEGFIEAWLDEQFGIGKKYCPFGVTVFSPVDKPRVRRVQLIATSFFLEEAFEMLLSTKKVDFFKVLSQVKWRMALIPNIPD